MKTRSQFMAALAVLALLLTLAADPEVPDARVYIDITSFENRLPVAISNFTADPGLAEIIRSDLEFTHAFTVANPATYTEPAAAPFSAENWLPLKVEAVLKGSVNFDRAGQKFQADAVLYDTVENRALFKRQYQSDVTLLRSLAHQISNDVYEALTGQPSVFRTRLAYVVESGGNKEIHLMDWDGGRSRRITRADTLTMAPRWSPTGRHLAYASLRRNRWGIYLLDLSRAKETLLYGNSSLSIPGSFAPESNSLYFAASERGESKLFRVDLDGGNLRQITSQIGIDVSPSVSPDGKFLAFVSDRGGSPQIYIMDSSGSSPRRITLEGRYNTSPAWSPKGDRIAFVGRMENGFQILTITPDGQTINQLTTAGFNESPSWSPDGRYIAYSSSTDRARPSAVFIMLANGEKKRQVSQAGQNATAPTWSPVFKF